MTPPTDPGPARGHSPYNELHRLRPRAVQRSHSPTPGSHARLASSHLRLLLPQQRPGENLVPARRVRGRLLRRLTGRQGDCS